jgi:hypothetical protein
MRPAARIVLVLWRISQNGNEKKIAENRILAQEGSQPVINTLSGGKQLPMPLGDDGDGAVHDLDGGLIVDRVGWHG